MESVSEVPTLRSAPICGPPSPEFRTRDAAIGEREAARRRLAARRLDRTGRQGSLECATMYLAATDGHRNAARARELVFQCIAATLPSMWPCLNDRQREDLLDVYIADGRDPPACTLATDDRS